MIRLTRIDSEGTEKQPVWINPACIVSFGANLRGNPACPATGSWVITTAQFEGEPDYEWVAEFPETIVAAIQAHDRYGLAPKVPPRGVEALDLARVDGWVDGVREFAIWRSGVQLVGCREQRLDEVLRAGPSAASPFSKMAFERLKETP